MNLASILVLAVIVIVVALAAWEIIRPRRGGRTASYCSGCALKGCCGKNR